MRLRKYAITFMDNWTPLRYFWTERGARKVAAGLPTLAPYLWRWNGLTWIKLK